MTKIGAASELTAEGNHSAAQRFAAALKRCGVELVLGWSFLSLDMEGPGVSAAITRFEDNPIGRELAPAAETA